MTDEQRADAIGGLPGSAVDTPWMTQLRTQGVYFPRAYSACPVCIPARRTLMTGKNAYNHGVLMNQFSATLDGDTLPAMLGRAGYQTHLCGKLHLFPVRKLYGFDSSDWADSASGYGVESDYERFLKENGLFLAAGLGHGMSNNGWAARPWHLEERFHFTNWCTDRALRFLERRDPTRPFFLNLSYYQPHAPCTPPAYYFEKYLRRALPDCPVGDWAGDLPNSQRGEPVDAWRVTPDAGQIREYSAGYYGCVEHIDHQLGRVLRAVPGDNTIVLFCSDHGEMLGDHGWIRKRSAYEGSARIPLFVYLPDELARRMGVRPGTVCGDAAELMDVLPTLMDLAGLPVPTGLDGLSLLPALRGQKLPRDCIHGECARLETIGSGMQFVTDGRRKYIWYPALALGQFFDLETDPKELHDLSGDPARAEELALWRGRLIAALAGRPEGFTDGADLLKLDGPTPISFPR